MKQVLGLLLVVGILAGFSFCNTEEPDTQTQDPYEVDGAIPTKIGIDLPSSMSADGTTNRLALDTVLEDYTFDEYDVYMSGYSITKHCAIVAELVILELEILLEAIKAVEETLVSLNGEIYYLADTNKLVQLSGDATGYTLIYGTPNATQDAFETKLAYITWDIVEGKAKGKALFQSEQASPLYQQAGVSFDHQSATPTIELFLTEGDATETTMDKLHIKVAKTSQADDSDYEIWVYPRASDQFDLKLVEESGTTVPYASGDRSNLPQPNVFAYGYVLANGQGAASCEFNDYAFYNPLVSIDVLDLDFEGDLLLLSSKGVFYFEADGSDMGHTEDITEIDPSYSATDAASMTSAEITAVLDAVNDTLDGVVTNQPDYKRYENNLTSFTQPQTLVTAMAESNVSYLESLDPTDPTFFDDLN